MKRISLVSALAGAALFGVAGLAAPAVATPPGSSGGSNAVTEKLHKVEYVWLALAVGSVWCNETSHPKFDTVTCKFTGGQTLPAGASGTYSWISDFGNRQNGGVLTYTVDADGAGLSGKATYPNG